MKKKFALFSIITICYLIIRLWGILYTMNEYTDYDEGTYLLIARMINHGYLPYRDIYAVHPPLYYYLLALWLRFFGDSYIVGRTLSVFVGLISIFLAYLIGRELKDDKLGIAFASLLALDPLLIRMNSLVLHETIIEFFTLLSMYYFVKYFKKKVMKYAYLSLFWAGLGSTAKFTIIPFLISLYLVIVLSLNKKSWNHFEGMVNSILTSRQIFIVLFAYLLGALAVISIVTVYPDRIVRLLIILPGVHPVNLVGHKYFAALFLLLWMGLTVYILDIKYSHKVLETLVILLKNWKIELKLGFVVVLAKALVEVPLGVVVSRDYILQTYLPQGGRYTLFTGFFSIINKILRDLGRNSPEVLLHWVPLISLLAWVILVVSRGHEIKVEKPLAGLFVVNLFMFLFLMPVIPDERFIYPLFLVTYLMLLYSLMSLRISPKKMFTAVLITLLFISAVDYGLLVNYPSGRLKLAFGPHTKELRDDLKLYLEEHKINPGLCLSVNPMNAYYLGLKVDPYSIDTFGWIYLKKENSDSIIKRMEKTNTSCVLFSTWMYAIMPKSKRLEEGYSKLVNQTLQHGTLLFGESYEDNEVIEMFSFGANMTPSKLKIVPQGGRLSVLYNLSEILEIFVLRDNTTIDHRLKIFLEGDSYLATWAGSDGGMYSAVVWYMNDDGIRITPLNNTSLGIVYDGIAFSEDGELLPYNVSQNVIRVCTQRVCVSLTGRRLELKEKGFLVASGNKIEIHLVTRRS
ncbi:hypothetical protein A3L09_07650 [Thermococcus profundus]|uniref:Glycosyltransferase RgtA/B/C/D-like domain-containing protein n=1 Tax=Thermococcus profundus TaxID=49899 RepID=A0A2Z2MGT6_THEPR|nr:glycosyltransferase family 39 protein [Thermococcus profundus]ASJ03134.1 hypothetical protein A3L09_07650 [Thermococcus profundus]